MTVGANKFLHICYGKAKDHLAALKEFSAPDFGQYI